MDARAGLSGRKVLRWSLLHAGALVSMGESWHNNHHAYPGFWAVRALEALGLVWDVKTAEHLPPRPGTRPLPPRGEARRAPCFGPRAASRC